MDSIHHVPIPLPGILQDHAGITVALIVVTGLIAHSVYTVMQGGWIPGIEIIGPGERFSLTFAKAKMAFAFHAQEIMWNAIENCKGPFQMMTLSGPKIVFPGRYTNELKNIKDLTMTRFVKNDFFLNVPGFEAQNVALETNILQDAVRVKLTQSLGPVSRDLCEEADTTIDEYYNHEDSWHLLDLRKHVQEFVACLSTRTFLGPEVRRDQDWIRISVDYTIDLFKAVRVLRMWPKFMVPIVHWFLPETRQLRKTVVVANRIIDTERDRRRKERADLRAKDLPIPKTSDSLGWMEDLTPPGVDFDVTGGQLSLTMAAIHTTADLLTKCLYYIAQDPHLCQDLRDEIADTLRTQGWKKTSLYNMKLVDSLMKEVQRIAPPSFVTLHRGAESTITLKDGTVIPKGANIQVSLDRHFSSPAYMDPQSFDARRYLKLRQIRGQENQWQFVTTSEDAIGFGHGTHACPGRFFASNEVKIALAHLLLKFDWKLDDDKQQPESPFLRIGTENMVHPELKIRYKPRTPEINMMSYLEESA